MKKLAYVATILLISFFIDQAAFTATILDFEGLGDQQPIGTLDDATFSSNWLSINSCSAGGSGNFVNPPSGVGIAYILVGGPGTTGTITFATPVSAVSTRYASRATPLTLTALDANGNVLDTTTGPQTPYANIGQCGLSDSWGILSVSSPTKPIASVSLHDTGNFFAIDNFTFISNPILDCVLNSGQGCILTFASLIPYIDVVATATSVSKGLCDATNRYLMGDLIGTGTKLAITFLSLAGATVEDTAATICLVTAVIPIAGPISAVGVPVSVVSKLIRSIISCIEGFLHDSVVKLCGPSGFTCFMDWIVNSIGDLGSRVFGVFTHSPVDIEIFDSSGQHLLLDGNEEVNSTIPQAWLFKLTNNEEAALINDANGEFQIQVKGRSTAMPGNTFDLGIIQPLGDGTYNSIIFQDVPTQAGAIASTVINENTTNYTLSIDIDGNGTIDGVRSPTFINDVLFATVDIDPNTLNVKSGGKTITSYIELPVGFDVSNIKVSSIRLNGTIPAQARPTEINDHNSNGVLDLMVKFDRQAVKNLFNSDGLKQIEITGSLLDGTPFKGSDTIKVIH